MGDIRPPKLEVYRDKAVARDYGQRWSGALGKKRDVLKARAIIKAFGILKERHGKYNSNFSKQGLGFLLK